MAKTYKDWHEKLPFALHACQTLICISTGATLIFLVYEMEVVLPINVEIRSLRVLVKLQLKEAEWVKN